MLKEKLHLGRRAKKEEVEAKEDLPAQLAAQREKEHEAPLKSRKDGQLATQAGQLERQHLQSALGGAKKLEPHTRLPSLPHEGKTKEEMSEHERIERGAAVSERERLN